MRIKYFILSAIMLLSCLKTIGQDCPPTRILIVFDASGSMWADMGSKKRIQVAKELLYTVVDSLGRYKHVDLALRVYGHQSSKEARDCKDTRLEIPFSPDNAADIKKRVKEIVPVGTTPIAYSLTQAAADFPKTAGHNMIILITDGVEECDGDPCAVSKALQERNIILKPLIVGIGMGMEFAEKFKCVGRYFSAKTESGAKEIVSTVISQAVSNTTVQVNLNDSGGRAVETNVNMTFINEATGEVEYNFIHAMNQNGQPDTFIIDALNRYTLHINTIPPVYKRNVTIRSARHNIIDVTAPQGELKLVVNTIDYLTLKCLVKDNNTGRLIHVQDFNTAQKYLTGTYDLEVLTLPKLKFDRFRISQGKTSTINIPQPGKIELTYPADIIGSIYQMQSGNQKWLVDLQGAGTTRKDLFYLQPGEYKVVYQIKSSTATIETREKDFTIISGGFEALSLK